MPPSLKAPRPINITPGFNAKSLLQMSMKSDVLLVLHKAVKEVDDSLRGANTRLIGSVSKRAEAYLKRSILRPGESGIDEDGNGKSRNRQTKNFTFGVRGGGAFRGVTFEGKNEVGFGYPDIAIADSKTKGIWRVLEFGLGARKGRPQEGSIPSLASGLAGRYGSKGKAMLPQRFGFSSPNPASAQLIIISGPGSTSPMYYHTYKSKAKRRNQARKGHPVKPKGQRGKFFITRALDDMVVEARKEYEKIPTRTYGKL